MTCRLWRIQQAEGGGWTILGMDFTRKDVPSEKYAEEKMGKRYLGQVWSCTFFQVESAYACMHFVIWVPLMCG
jgi:hypothetical protein